MERTDNSITFSGLINYTVPPDSVLKYLQNSTEFKRTSKIVQNKFVDSILSVCQNNIVAKLSLLNFTWADEINI